MNTDFNLEHKEGPVAKTIEEQTAKIPSDIFLWAALGSIGLSLACKIAKETTWRYLLVNGHQRSCCWDFTTNW